MMKNIKHVVHDFYVVHKKHIWACSGVLIVIVHYLMPEAEVHTTVALGFMVVEFA